MIKNQAFTLIELLIVVAIIGILAAIAVPNFLNAQIKARLARAQADHQAIVTALESYYIDHQAYPTRSHSSNGDMGFRMLTTPFAYIHSILPDPFARKHVQRRENEYDLSYEFDTINWQSENSNMYFLECLGPDGRDDYNSTFYPSHHPDFQFFDVTNGLSSKGDMVRAGGVYTPRWYRERKGGPRTTGKDWI